jgi:maltodextrin utilization protein YvdJ
MENVEALFNNDYVYNGEKVSSRKYFTSIKAKADLKESDENYDTLIEYAWNKSSVTFVPQSTSEYYVVQLVLTDDLTEVQTKKYMAIRISETPDSLAGENDWLANNIPSVVLLCVAGASFIALIVLLVIKPKDKGDIDTIDTDEKKTKKSKKAKKAEAID